MTFFGTLDQSKPLIEGQPIRSINSLYTTGEAEPFNIYNSLGEGIASFGSNGNYFYSHLHAEGYSIYAGGMSGASYEGHMNFETPNNNDIVFIPSLGNGNGLVRIGGINPTIEGDNDQHLTIKTYSSVSANSKNINLTPFNQGKVLIGGSTPTIMPAVAGTDLNIDSNRIGFPTFTGKINLHGYTNHPVVIWEGPGEGNASLHFQSNTTSPGPNSAVISSNGSMQISPRAGLSLQGGSGDLEFQAGTLGLVFNVNGEGGANSYVKFTEASSGEEFFTLKYMTDAPNTKLIKIEKADLPFDFNGNEIQNAGPINTSTDALPTAATEYEGQIRTVQGGTGVASRAYVCLKNSNDSFSWVQFAAGSV